MARSSIYSSNPISFIRKLMEGECELDISIPDAYLQLNRVSRVLLISLAKQNPDICVSPDLFVDVESSGYVKIDEDDDYYPNPCFQSKSRYIFYPITLIFDTSYYSHNPDEERGATHSTAVIIDNYNHTIEYYEPNGPLVPWHPRVDRYLQKYFTNLYPNYRYITMTKYCPGVGPQAIAGLPFCTIFTLLQLWSRIVSPDLDQKILFEQLTKLSRIEMAKLIVRFICHLYNYAKYLNLFELDDIYDDEDAFPHTPYLHRHRYSLYLDNKREELLALNQQLKIANPLYEDIDIAISKLAEQDDTTNLDSLSRALVEAYNKLDIQGLQGIRSFVSR